MDDLIQIIANNITFYRKSLGLTQSELAEKLNYSDKAVSKWERGESCPDITTLAMLAKLFNTTVDGLITDRKKVKKVKPLVALLSSGLVWLVFTAAYVLISLIFPSLSKTWLAFIYAIPVNAIVLVVLFAVWKQRFGVLLAESAIMWSVALSIFLTLTIENIFFVFFIPIPLQVLAILWYRMGAKTPLRFNFIRRKAKKTDEKNGKKG